MERIQNLYLRLKNTDLVRFNDTSAESLNDFELLLNEAQLASNVEVIASNVIRDLYLRNKSGFYKYVSNIDMNHLVLFVSPELITNVLGLRYVVKVYQHNNRFHVRCLDDRQQHQNKNKERKQRKYDVKKKEEHTFRSRKTRTVSVEDQQALDKSEQKTSDKLQLTVEPTNLQPTVELSQDKIESTIDWTELPQEDLRNQ